MELARVKTAGVLLVQKHLDVRAALKEVCSDPDANANEESAAPHSWLYSHSATLGQPATLLATRHLAGLTVEVALQTRGDQLFPPEHRASLASLLSLARSLQRSGLIDSALLLSSLVKEVASFPLELVWGLHSLHLLPLRELLCSEEAIVTGYLVPALVATSAACQGEVESRARAVLQDVSALLLGEAVCGERDSSTAVAQQILCAVMEATFPPSSSSPFPSYTICEAMSECSRVEREQVMQFLSSLLSHLFLSHPPSSLVSALAQQHQWKTASLPPHSTALYNKIAKFLPSGKAVAVLREALQHEELNWGHLLGFTASLINMQPGAAKEIKGLVDSLVSLAIMDCHAHPLKCALVLARQCGGEGAHLFPPYREWFQQTFGDSVWTVVSSRKTLQFVVKTLTDLVPHEPAQYLKVHIRRPPHRLAKCHSLVSDFIELARTRLSDLKEPLDAETAECHSETVKAMEEVERALAYFNQHGKISPNVIVASTFKKPYFAHRFLPALLSPPQAGEGEGLRDRFIHALARENKIPSRMLESYRKACHQSSEPQAASTVSGLAPVTSLLQQLATTTSRDGGPRRLLLSRLSAALEDYSGRQGVGREGRSVDLRSPSLQPWQVQVVDSLLETVCGCVVEQYNCPSGDSPPHTRFTWLSSFMCMLSGHTSLHPPLFLRLRELLPQLVSGLSASHLLGLAVLCSHLHTSPCTLLAHQVSTDFSAALVSALPVHSAGAMRATLRFCCLFLHHSLLCTPRESGSSERCAPHGLIEKAKYVHDRLLFLKRLSRLPSLKGTKTEDSDLLDSVGALLEVGALRDLWETTRASFSQWLCWELAVDPLQDFLPSHSRLDYLRHTLHSSELGDSPHSAFGLLFSALVEQGSVPSYNAGLHLLQEVSCSLPPLEHTKLPLLVLAMEQVLATQVTDEGNMFEGDDKRRLVQHCLSLSWSLPPHLFFCNSMEEGPGGGKDVATFLERIVAPYSTQLHLLSLSTTKYLLQGLRAIGRRHEAYHRQFLGVCPLYHASLIAHWPQVQPIAGESFLDRDDTGGVEAVSAWLQSDLQSPTPSLSSPLVLGVCAFHHLLSSEHTLPRLPAWGTEVSVVVMECCVQGMEAHSATADSAEHRLVSLAQAVLAQEPSAVEVFFSDVHQCSTVCVDLLLQLRKHLPGCSPQPLAILLFRTLRGLPGAIFSQLAEQPSLLPLCLSAHTLIMDTNTPPPHTSTPLLYQAFTVAFIQECTTLTRKAIQSSPAQRLKENETLCHSCIRPFLQNFRVYT